MKPEEVSQEQRSRLENIEIELKDLKKQQQEIVERSIVVMYEFSGMVEREKREWKELHYHNKLDKF